MWLLSFSAKPSTPFFYSCRTLTSDDENATAWETVGPNLLRNTASGKYYARFKIPGKQKGSMPGGTDTFSPLVLPLA